MADKESTSTVNFEGGAIGYVRLVKGHVTATAQDGTVRVLTVGDMVYPDEVIQTGPDGGVVIEFRDGAALALAGDSEALLDREVYDITTAQEIEDQTAAIEDIQQAILAGADPTQILEAPAAGPEGGELLGDGAEEPVAIARTGQRITPQSGFETSAPQFAAEGERQEDELPVIEQVTTSDSTPDANQAPTDIALDNQSVAENSAGAVIGTLSTTDPDAGDSHTYTVSDSRFEVVGDQLKLKAGESLDYESEVTVNVTVTSTDSGTPGLSVDETFTITVTNVDDNAPTLVDDDAANNEVAENAS
ncbi:MAG: retention module-containing protein, partial [Sedimenticola sp.]